LDWSRNVKKYIPVPATRTGIVFVQIRFPVPVLKNPFWLYPIVEIADRKFTKLKIRLGV
jgi:hypothetical protein